MDNGISLRKDDGSQSDFNSQLSTQEVEVVFESKTTRTIRHSESGNRQKVSKITHVNIGISQSTSKSVNKRKVAATTGQKRVGLSKKALAKTQVSPNKQIFAFGFTQLSPHSGFKHRFGTSPDKDHKSHRSHYAAASYAAGGATPVPENSSQGVESFAANDSKDEVKLIEKRKAEEPLDGEDLRVKIRKPSIARNLSQVFNNLEASFDDESQNSKLNELDPTLLHSSSVDVSSNQDGIEIIPLSSNDSEERVSSGDAGLQVMNDEPVQNKAKPSGNIPSMFFLSGGIGGDSDQKALARAMQFVHNNKYEQAITEAAKIQDIVKRNACYAKLAKAIAGQSTTLTQKDTYALSNLQSFASRCAAEAKDMKDKAYYDAATVFFSNKKWEQGNNVLEAGYSYSAMFACAHYLLTNHSLAGNAWSRAIDKMVCTASGGKVFYSPSKSREENIKAISLAFAEYALKVYQSESVFPEGLRLLVWDHLSEAQKAFMQ